MTYRREAGQANYSYVPDRSTVDEAGERMEPEDYPVEVEQHLRERGTHVNPGHFPGAVVRAK